MKALPIIVLGAGGHARVLLDALQQLNVPVIGVTDLNPEKWGTKLLGVQVLGDDEHLATYSSAEVLLVNGLGSVGTNQERNSLFMKFKNKGFSFFSIMHPRACITPRVQLGEGVQIMAGAVIQTGAAIGSNTIINTCTTIDHDCIIGEGVHIAPGVTISGATSIGNGTFIGAGTTIIQGVSIGDGCLIGAGSMVLRDVPSRCLSYGVPARIVGHLD